jgi:beta-glucosidase
VLRPEQELKGFAKVDLEPGQTQAVTIPLDRTAFAFWHDRRHAWVAEAGSFELRVGSSSQDIHLLGQVELTETATFGGPPKASVRLTIETPLPILIESAQAMALIERHLPGFGANASMGATLGLSLVQLSGFAPDMLKPETLAAIAADLSNVTE